MTTFDLTPLFRSTIGFDRIGRLLDSATHLDENRLSYPPYNIEKTGDDSYRIVLAVAGFSEGDLDIKAEAETLTVRGKIEDKEEAGSFLHQGIAGRAFERRFQLADYISVSGASLENGLLSVELVREVPEALKPRSIAIETKAIEHKKAA